MANFFDQFDEKPSGEGNFFDQYDEMEPETPTIDQTQVALSESARPPAEAGTLRRERKSLIGSVAEPSPVEIDPSVRSYQDREVATLPEPHEGMFDDMTNADAEALWRAYANHPNTQNRGFSLQKFGDDLWYRGKPIPAWQGDPVKGVSDFGSDVGSAVVNLGRNLGRTVLRGGEAAGVFPEGVTEKSRELYPELGFKNPGIGLATELAIPLGVATKLPKLQEAIKYAPKTAKAAAWVADKVASALVGGAGVAVSVDPKTTSPWILGDAEVDASQRDYQSREMGPTAKEELQQQVKIALDSAIITAPIQLGAQGGKAVVDFMKRVAYEPIAKVFSPTKSGNATVRELLDRAAEVQNAKTPEEVDRAWKEIIDFSSDPKNQREMWKIGTPGIEDVEVSRTTAQTIQKGLEGRGDEGARSVSKMLEQQEKDVIDRGGIRTSTVAESPIAALDKLSKQTETAFGGRPGIQKAAESVQERATGIVKGAREKQIAKEAEVAAEEQSIGEALQTQDVLPRPQAGGLDVGIDKATSTEAEKVTRGLEKAEKARVDKSNKRYREAMDDAEADLNSLKFRMDEEGMKVPNSVREAVETSDGTIRDLEKSVRPIIQRELDQAYKRRDENTVNSLKYLLSEGLDADQKRFLEARGDLKTVEGLKEAKTKFLEEVAPFRQGATGEFRDIKKKHKFDDVGYLEKSEELLEKYVKDPRKHRSIGLVAQSLGQTEEGTEALSRYVAGKLFGDLQTKKIDSTTLTNTARQYSSVLEELNPGSGKKLNDLVNTLESKELSVAAKNRELAALKEEADKTEIDIYKNKFKQFYLGGADVNPSGAKAFKDLFEHEENANRLQDIIDNADEDTLKGIKAAYGKFVGDRVFTGMPGPQGKNLAVQKGLETISDDNTILDFGKRIFKDQPEVMAAYEGLLRGSTRSAISRKAAAMGGEPQNDAEARRVFSRGVRLIYGPLSRRGTQLNTVFGTVLDLVKGPEMRNNVRDVIMANPEEFSRIAKNLLDAKNKVNPETARNYFNLLVQANVYKKEDYEDFESGLADSLAKKADQAVELGEQTRDALLGK